MALDVGPREGRSMCRVRRKWPANLAGILRLAKAATEFLEDFVEFVVSAPREARTISKCPTRGSNEYKGYGDTSKGDLT